MTAAVLIPLCIYLYAGYTVAELAAPGFKGPRWAQVCAYLALTIGWALLIPFRGSNKE